jgi:hypothetical protein
MSARQCRCMAAQVWRSAATPALKCRFVMP